MEEGVKSVINAILLPFQIAVVATAMALVIAYTTIISLGPLASLVLFILWCCGLPVGVHLVIVFFLTALSCFITVLIKE